MSPIPDGFADCSIRLTYAALSRSAYVTLGVDNTENDLSAEALAAVIGDAWVLAGSVNTGFDANVTTNDVTARLGTASGEPIVGIHAVNLQGAGDNNPAPPNVATLINKQSARGGRRGRGRMFIPWWQDEAEIDGSGTITPASVIQRQAFIQKFFDTLAAGGVPMVLLHADGKTAPGPPDRVTSVVVQNRVATQRRRLGR
jgi:hypothetical protein